MSRNINQPSNQIKLTNVSVVRLRKAKKRFEIACYKNKVLEYRQGIETDLDSVLQISQVFLSVSKGQTAPRGDLDRAFGKGTALDRIIEEILKKGEIQVGEGERKEQLERLKAEVVTIVTSKVVDPRTKVVYSPNIIEQALDLLMREGGRAREEARIRAKEREKATAALGSGSGTPISGKLGSATSGGVTTPASEPIVATGQKDERQKRQEQDDATAAANQLADLNLDKATWTGVVIGKSAKVQALDAIRALIAHQPIPVMRARLKVQVAGPAAAVQKAATKDRIMSLVEEMESEDFANGGRDWEMTCFVDPGAHRAIQEILSGKEFRGKGNISVIGEAEAVEE